MTDAHDPTPPAGDPTLDPFFHPRGILVAGVSTEPHKLGYGLARNLVESGYAGAIHFVNPRGGALFGRPVHPSIDETPDPADLAVLLIPAPLMPEALEACGRRGLRAAIIAAGGFQEIGPEGARLEADCLAIAGRHGMRLLGPNCIGVIDSHAPLNTTFLPPPGPAAGDIAFISHSGALCAAVIDWSLGQGFGLSRLVSLGNQVDVQETDVLAPVAADPHTRVITLYLEGIRDGRRFVAAAAEVTRRKPIIALKVGRSEGGRQAVASHTGSLAGREAAYEAVFRRAGVLRAETTAELFDWARALAWCPLPAGGRVAVLTNAGGPGVTAVDALEAAGLVLAALDPATTTALQTLLPPAASVGNPVDMLAGASPEQYAESLRLLLADPGVDSALVIIPPPPVSTAAAVAEALADVITGASKPVLITFMGSQAIQAGVDILNAARIPDYRFPEQAAGALAALTRRARFLAAAGTAQPAPVEEPAARSAVAALLDPLKKERRPETADAPVPVPPEALFEICRVCGIPTPPLRLARTAGEAAAAARELGFPVVLKIAAPTITHKSDVGGVLLDLADEAAVRAGFARLLQAVQDAQPGAAVDGVTVQPMIPPGQEVIVGAVQDPQFGPLILFGSGGVEVEGLKDIAFALAPATPAEAGHLLAQTWAGRRLAGFRSLPPADREAVLAVIDRLGRLAADFPELAEIEINPLRVLPAGQGAVALDVRAVLVVGE